jgi:hypothetical protein
MKCPIDMGSGGTIYVLSFIMFDSGIRRLLGGDTCTYIHTDRELIS